MNENEEVRVLQANLKALGCKFVLTSGEERKSTMAEMWGIKEKISSLKSKTLAEKIQIQGDKLAWKALCAKVVAILKPDYMAAPFNGEIEKYVFSAYIHYRDDLKVKHPSMEDLASTARDYIRQNRETTAQYNQDFTLREKALLEFDKKKDEPLPEI